MSFENISIEWFLFKSQLTTEITTKSNIIKLLFNSYSKLSNTVLSSKSTLCFVCVSFIPTFFFFVLFFFPSRNVNVQRHARYIYILKIYYDFYLVLSDGSLNVSRLARLIKKKNEKQLVLENFGVFSRNRIFCFGM